MGFGNGFFSKSALWIEYSVVEYKDKRLTSQVGGRILSVVSRVGRSAG